MPTPACPAARRRLPPPPLARSTPGWRRRAPPRTWSWAASWWTALRSSPRWGGYVDGQGRGGWQGAWVRGVLQFGTVAPGPQARHLLGLHRPPPKVVGCCNPHIPPPPPPPPPPPLPPPPQMNKLKKMALMAVGHSLEPDELAGGRPGARRCPARPRRGPSAGLAQALHTACSQQVRSHNGSRLQPALCAQTPNLHPPALPPPRPAVAVQELRRRQERHRDGERADIGAQELGPQAA
jgi:hypothetical protein